MTRLVVPFSVAVSFLLGLVFIFVWAPHPWGWYGIDFYHQLAIDLAQGRPFSTMDVPWGYAYFLAPFYRLFGPNPAPALVAQAALNALIPALIYRYAHDTFDRNVAALAALLTGLFSFNTVYASTASSDSVCTVLFVVMVLVFVAARRQRMWPLFALAGALGGVAAQFRPNLILVPLLLAAFHFTRGPRDWRRLRDGIVIISLAAAMLLPWTIRNYRLTAQIIPTSTHGGQQLWYGTLQIGRYLNSRAANPRKVFETPVFDYSSLLKAPIVIEGTLNCAPGKPDSVEIVYWTNADSAHHRVPLRQVDRTRYTGTIPASLQPRMISYYAEVRWADEPHVQYTPEAAPNDPFVYFLSTDHVSDLDTRDALLDIFDLVRILRHIAWTEPVRAEDRLDADRNGRLDESDFRVAVGAVLSRLADAQATENHVRDVLASSTGVRARFVDGSELVVPRAWHGLVTDLEFGQGLASALMHTSYRFTQPKTPSRTPLEALCRGLSDIGVNLPFYRTQPHEMQRYTALAIDNIRRDPGSYASSVLYRALRLFIIRGTEDRDATVQFSGSRGVYLAASVASGVYFALFLVGAILAWRKAYEIALPLALIIYIPATIAFVLTNMRYTITVQPFMFVFVAVSLVAMLEQVGALPPVPRGAAAAQNPSGSRTTLRP